MSTSSTTTAATSPFPNVTISNHPILLHKLATLRTTSTPSPIFRSTLTELTYLLGYEATNNLSTKTGNTPTPVSATCVTHKLAQKVSLIPIMRSGLPMVEPLLSLLPNANVHHVGMYRSFDNLLPVQYYNNLPKTTRPSDVVFVLDPMIATSGTLNAVINILKQWGGSKLIIHVISIIASKAGLEKLCTNHPDVKVSVVCVDEELNEDGIVLPGLGDVGERIYGKVWEEEEEGSEAQDEGGGKRVKK